MEEMDNKDSKSSQQKVIIEFVDNSDFYFFNNTHIFKVSRKTISLASTKLKEITEDVGRQNNNSYEINDEFVTSETFNYLLQFIYTPSWTKYCLPVNSKVVSGLIYLSYKYEIEGLSCLCEQYYSSKVKDNVLESLLIADKYKMKQLREKSIIYYIG